MVKLNGKLYTRSHDGKILREDYLEAHKAYVSKPKNQRNNTVSGQEGVTYVKDSNGKVWYFDEKTGKAIIKDGYNKIVKQESAFIANQLHTAADGIGTDNELLAKGVKNIYSADILAGVNAELRTKDSDYDVDVQKSQMMPVEALILDENNHKSARPLLQTLIDSGAMTVEEQARTIKREMEYELAGDGKVGIDLGRVWEHFEFGTSYTSTADLNSIMQMATSREVRLEIENQYKNDPQFANLEPNEGSYVRARIGVDGGLLNWNAQEVDQFDANWIKSGAYAEATYDGDGNLIDAGDQEHRNAVVDRLVFGYQNKEALNKGLEVINDDPYSADYIYLETRAGEEVAKDPDGKYQARFTDQDNIQRYLAGFHSDETGRVDSGNVSASNTCLFKGVKPPRIQAEEALYDANNGDYSKTFDSIEPETYEAIAVLVANGDVAGVKDMKELYNKAYNSAQSDNDKTKIKANAMLSGQVQFNDAQKVDFCLELMHSIDANRGRGGSTGMSAGYTNSADYQTEQLKAILQNNPQIMDSVRERVEKENFSYTTTIRSGGGPSGAATVTNIKTDTKNSYIELLNDTKHIDSKEVFFDSEGNKITDPDQIQAIKSANIRSLSEMRKYVAELEREFKKGVDAEGWLSDAANGLSEFSGIGTDREDVATEYRNAKLMLSQFEAAAQGRLRDSQGHVISAQDLAQQMLDKQNALAETNSDYKQTIAYGKMGIVLAPVIVATGGAGAAIGLVGGGTVAVAVGSGIAAGATTYGINALEYNTSYTGNTAEAREQNLQDSLVNGATTAIGIAQMKYIGGMANNLGTVARTSVRLGTTVAADTTVGAAAEGITTGDVSAEGLVSNMVMSGVGNVIGAKSLGKKQVAPTPNILDNATSQGSKPVGGSFSEKKFNQVRTEVREELANGATPERAAQIYKEADQVQVMNREQGRALKHEVEQASGFETHHKQRTATEKKGEAVIEKINENVSRTSDTILAEKNSGALAPHDAATLEDNLVNNLNTKEQIEQFKAQLKERVGTDADGNMFKYEVQGKDHAADLMAKADKKLKQLANFDDVMASIPEKGGIGDMTAIKSFINNPSTTAEQLDALIAKMEANPALKKFGGTKKLIADMKAKSDILKAKNKAPKQPVHSEAKSEPKAEEVVKSEVETKSPDEVKVPTNDVAEVKQSADETPTKNVEEQPTVEEPLPKPVEEKAPIETPTEKSIDEQISDLNNQIETAKKNGQSTTELERKLDDLKMKRASEIAKSEVDELNAEVPVISDEAQLAALEKEIKDLDGQIESLNKQIETAKKNGTSTAELNKKLDELKMKRAEKIGRSETIEIGDDVAPVTEKPLVETSTVEPKEVIETANSIPEAQIPAQHRSLWKACKARISSLIKELSLPKIANPKALIAKGKAILNDLRTITNSSGISAEMKVKLQQLSNKIKAMFASKNLTKTVDVKPVKTVEEAEKLYDQMVLNRTNYTQNKNSTLDFTFGNDWAQATYSGKSPRQHTQWKIHIYADSPQEWANAAQVAMPYLEQNKIGFKTVLGMHHFARNRNNVKFGANVQTGKSFTIYFENEEQFVQTAKALDARFKASGLKSSGTVATEAQIGDSGFLSYRHEGAERGAAYKPDEVEDPYLKSLQNNQAQSDEPIEIIGGGSFNTGERGSIVLDLEPTPAPRQELGQFDDSRVIIGGDAINPQLTPQQKIAIGEIGQRINNIRFESDVRSLQAKIDRLPNCPQKTQLQHQLNMRNRELTAPAGSFSSEWNEIVSSGPTISQIQEMNGLSMDIDTANFPFEFENIQVKLDSMPACPQKSDLQARLDQKRNEYNSNIQNDNYDMLYYDPFQFESEPVNTSNSLEVENFETPELVEDLFIPENFGF